jgi:hypothetical protein
MPFHNLPIYFILIAPQKESSNMAAALHLSPSQFVSSVAESFLLHDEDELIGQLKDHYGNELHALQIGDLFIILNELSKKISPNQKAQQDWITRIYTGLMQRVFLDDIDQIMAYAMTQSFPNQLAGMRALLKKNPHETPFGIVLHQVPDLSDPAVRDKFFNEEADFLAKFHRDSILDCDIAPLAYSIFLSFSSLPNAFSTLETQVHLAVQVLDRIYLQRDPERNQMNYFAYTSLMNLAPSTISLFYAAHNYDPQDFQPVKKCCAIS